MIAVSEDPDCWLSSYKSHKNLYSIIFQLFLPVNHEYILLIRLRAPMLEEHISNMSTNEILIQLGFECSIL